MSLAPLAYLLWTKVMKYNPKDPEWISRDRFVLSNGHACALLYRCVSSRAACPTPSLPPFPSPDTLSAVHL